MQKLKCLVFDVETSPMLAYVFGTRDQNIALNQIKQDWYVLAWAAKWLGDPASKVMYRDIRDEKRMGSDKSILPALWKLLDEADIVITQNGKSFDSRMLNARFIEHGMNPPSPYRHLDTLLIARRVARFTSNKLEYLTEKLCTKYKKLNHPKFPGMVLWKECLAGNPKAWDEMKKYNIHDVLSTEELYTKIRAWAPDSMPTVYEVEKTSGVCSRCGKGGLFVSRGRGINRQGFYRRYQCNGCGAWKKGEKI